MMVIMRKNYTQSRSSNKEATHERIVDAAARAIRRSGYNGTGVAQDFKAAAAWYAKAAAQGELGAPARRDACLVRAAAATSRPKT